MNTYFKSLGLTLTILIVAFAVAAISDINDLLDLEIISFLILVPAVIISSIFFLLYRKMHVWSVAVLLVGIAYIYFLPNVLTKVEPYGILIYTGIIYLPLIILGSMFSSFWRAYKIKKGTYV